MIIPWSKEKSLLFCLKNVLIKNCVHISLLGLSLQGKVKCSPLKVESWAGLSLAYSLYDTWICKPIWTSMVVERNSDFNFVFYLLESQLCSWVAWWLRIPIYPVSCLLVHLQMMCFLAWKTPIWQNEVGKKTCLVKDRWMINCEKISENKGSLVSLCHNDRGNFQKPWVGW